MIDSGNPTQECVTVVSNDVMADLSQEGLIGVEGADATTFLQGQFTCDLHEIGLNMSRLGAWCNPKGRVRVTFRVFQRNEGFYLALPAECVESTLLQLRKYILRSKVVLRNASREWIRLGCSGPTIDEGLRQVFSTLPSVPDQVVQEGTTTIIRLRGPSPRFEVLGENETLLQVWNTLKAANTVAIGVSAWSTLEVLSGVPAITQATTEIFVPHMLNLPEIGAVSFRKGCYTGQEIVARTQYLGKSKRRLYLAWIPVLELPRPGDPLWAPTGEEEQHPGQIVNVAPAPEGGSLVLAVIAVADAQEGKIHLRDRDGHLLELRTLPYPFQNE
ncbi:tRNA-modifying protein YgfZ [Gammaproteobacteria bacterium]